MQPVILTMLVISQGHLDKTLIQLEKWNFVKRSDRKLLEWLIASVTRCADKS